MPEHGQQAHREQDEIPPQSLDLRERPETGGSAPTSPPASEDDLWPSLDDDEVPVAPAGAGAVVLRDETHVETDPKTPSEATTQASEPAEVVPWPTGDPVAAGEQAPAFPSVELDDPGAEDAGIAFPTVDDDLAEFPVDDVDEVPVVASADEADEDAAPVTADVVDDDVAGLFPTVDDDAAEEDAVVEDVTVEDVAVDSAADESAADEVADVFPSVDEDAIADEVAGWFDTPDPRPAEIDDEVAAEDLPDSALGVDEPDADELAVDEPADDGLAVDEPAVDGLAVDESVVDEPAADEPAADEPVVEEPAVDEPGEVSPAAHEVSAERESSGLAELAASDAREPDAFDGLFGATDFPAESLGFVRGDDEHADYAEPEAPDASEPPGFGVVDDVRAPDTFVEWPEFGDFPVEQSEPVLGPEDSPGLDSADQLDVEPDQDEPEQPPPPADGPTGELPIPPMVTRTAEMTTRLPVPDGKTIPTRRSPAPPPPVVRTPLSRPTPKRQAPPRQAGPPGSGAPGSAEETQFIVRPSLPPPPPRVAQPPRQPAHDLDSAQLSADADVAQRPTAWPGDVEPARYPVQYSDPDLARPVEYSGDADSVPLSRYPGYADPVQARPGDRDPSRYPDSAPPAEPQRDVPQRDTAATQDLVRKSVPLEAPRRPEPTPPAEPEPTRRERRESASTEQAATRAGAPEVPRHLSAEPHRRAKAKIIGGVLAAVLALAAGVIVAVPGLADKLGFGEAAAPVEIAPPAPPVQFTATLRGPGADLPAPSAAGVQAVLAGPTNNPALGTLTGTVIDPTSGEVLFALNPTTPLVPASTAKLLTTAAALLALPHAEQLSTKVVAGDKPGTVIIVGGGDPTLSSLAAGKKSVYPGAAYLDDLVAQVKAAGPVDTVLVDLDRYAGAFMAAGWDPRDVAGGHIAPVVPAMIDGGRADPTKPISQRTDNPARVLAEAFAKRIGATVPAKALTTAPQGAKVLGEVRSAPIVELVDNVLQRSDNVLAETLAREVARATNKEASFVGATLAIVETLRTNGFDVANVTLSDGSGLSTQDQVTAALLADILKVAAAPDGTDPRTAKLRPLLGGLPVAGGSGTLATRYQGPTAGVGKGWVRAKTGTLPATGVNSLAGVVLDKDGRLLVFALMTNGSNTLEAQPALDVVAATLRQCGCQQG